MGAQVRWELRWEGSFAPAEHDTMADLLGLALGQVRPADADIFVGGRSWAGARPELRLLAHDELGLAAHIGVLRRNLRIGATDVAVADLGLFAVRPDSQRRKLGSELLAELQKVLLDLGVPFGFLNCRPDLIDFYSRNGWRLLPAEVSLRHVHPGDPLQVLTIGGPVFVLPVAADLDSWPAGEIIDRNGWQV
jgi:nodulation protein A